jgi:predicted ArsR family transcriptional regulator
MPRRVNDYRGLTQKSRLKLLHAVQRVPGRLLQELAEEAGMPVSTARDHLHVLEDEGLVISVLAETGRRGRPPKRYSPVRRVEHSPVAQQRADAARWRGDLLRSVEPELDHSASLGTEAAHQLDTLYEHLDDAGLAPEIDEEELTVTLLPCLYEDLIDAERPLVCSVHAKLVRHQLEQTAGPLELRSLHPFVGPRRCVLVLGMHGEASRSARPGGIDGNSSDAEVEQGALRALRDLSSSPETPPRTDDAG